MRDVLRSAARWVRAHAIATLVVCITAGFALTAFVIIEQEQKADRQALENDAEAAAEAAERREQICAAFVKSQATDRLLIDTVLQDGDGGIPLLDVPAYQSLPPLIQEYLRQIAEPRVPGPDDPPPLAERLARFREESLGRDDLPEFCLE